MKTLLFHLSKIFLSSIRDILPIVLVVTFFQVIVLDSPFNELHNLFSGIIFVVIGLALFVFGLELCLFPIGETMSVSLVEKGSLFWLIVFAFFLGFGTTFAEPTLIAVVKEAAEVAVAEDMIKQSFKDHYSFGLRFVVAVSVGFAIVLGVFRILKGWSIRYLLATGYVLIILATIFAPPEIIGIAYDTGGVTTSTITVPLIAATGIGLSRSIKGRNPMIDGFGIIAFASLTPIFFVLIYGIVI